MVSASKLNVIHETNHETALNKSKLSLDEKNFKLVERYFTKEKVNPFDTVEYEKRTAIITEPDGSVVFEMKDVEVPKGWSSLATNILASKYFRKAGVPGKEHETSIKEVIYRIAHTLKEAGDEMGYFENREEADVFEAELSYLLVHQIGAFNSPVWFNCGLYHQYGIKGSGGNWYWDQSAKELRQTTNAYSHPQCSACFIQSVEDDLMSIFELAKSEARLFKYGSGTGTNFSRIRGRQEKLSGGGTSSGLMSFLEVLDKGAGATKSGGTTRRAAKMVCLDMDHPEIVDFINWKVKEEDKVRALIQAGYSADFNGEAYHTISGQNANNSVRINDHFMQLSLEGGTWETRFRTTGEIANTYNAKNLLRQIATATWQCADPGIQFDDIINTWHTCKNSGRINGSNPCSEYMFLDDSACNLSSLNLMKFLDAQGNFDIERFRHAVRIFTLAQEIIVDFGSYPTQKIARNSHEYRPLGLGYANLGTLLMVKGIPYDSSQGRSIAAAITALMTGHAYRASAAISRIKGPFDGFEKNREPMMQVMAMHREHAYKINHEYCPENLLMAAREEWDEALPYGERYGYRNAQTTVLAPTGTIGLLMDCDTTGVEPDFALVKWKKLAGGGAFRMINSSFPPALQSLGYTLQQIDVISKYVIGSGSLDGNSDINPDALRKLQFTEAEINEAHNYVMRTQSIDDHTPFINPASLREYGLTEKQIQEAVISVNGAGCVEGAPFLKPEHYPVFDCANKSRFGNRFIDSMGHVKMMAAVQPFLSGSISKTVNLPTGVTIEDIENIIIESWRLGLKAIALYRDGSKASQPLMTKNNGENGTKEGKGNGSLKGQNGDQAKYARNEKELQDFLPDWALLRGQKRPLPFRRHGHTYDLMVGGHKLYLRTGEYDDGGLGEIFVDMWKEGAAYRSLMNCLAIAISVGLQYGVPLEKYVESFSFTRFEPGGITNHPNIRTCTSVLDLIFRVLGLDYLNRTDFVHVQPKTVEEIHKVEETSQSKTSGEKSKSVEQTVPAVKKVKKPGNGQSKIDQELGDLMGDAPICDICGHITVRNGACYKCLNCGTSIGCS